MIAAPGSSRRVLGHLIQWSLLAAIVLGLYLTTHPTTANANPASTIARYVGSQDTSMPGYVALYTNIEFYNAGWNRGSSGQSGSSILLCGRPRFISGTGYGTQIPGGLGNFMSAADIELRSKSYAQGYYYCAPSGVYLSVIIATSNNGGSTPAAPEVTSGRPNVSSLERSVVQVRCSVARIRKVRLASAR